MRRPFPTPRRTVFSAVLAALVTGPGAAQEVDPRLEPMAPAVLHYTSRVYGDRQPFAACATDVSPEPKPLIVDLIPGTLGNLEGAARGCRQICEIARENGLACVALRPCGRGNGSLYQGYGEVDVYEALGALKERVAAFGESKLELAGRTYRGDHLALYAVFPHPDGRRYAAVLAGGEPDAITWGSHIGLQLLPDYLVFDHDRVVAWGFWSNDWR